MLNINFVPDDYVQSHESRRTNLIYIVLFVIVMSGLFGCFLMIRFRQQALDRTEKQVESQLAAKKEEIKKVERLQKKRNEMWETALTTVGLIEPVARSIILASLTNNLPEGVSLLSLDIRQKESTSGSGSSKTSKSNYESKQGSGGSGVLSKASLESSLQTHIDIEGVAPSDLEVAFYIEKLGSSVLFSNVALVESREYRTKDSTEQNVRKFRHFKLTSVVNKGLNLTNQDVESIALADGTFNRTVTESN